MKKNLLSVLCGLAVAASISLSAWATELPAGVLNYVRQKDPNVRVRFDGLVLFSNGESYVPVIPQDPTLNPDPQQVLVSVPEDAPFPDLIQFDNHFFLMRLIQTSSGRLTFPKMDEYPIQLKEGLLPQDFVLPSNLYIPVELKVILGALPYNPSYTPTLNPVIVPVAKQLESTPVAQNPGAPKPMRSRLTYIFNLLEQKIAMIDPISGRKQGDITLDCVPSSLTLSQNGKLLFAPCLSTNELVVVDTGSNLVKTRVPVGQRPDAVMVLPDNNAVVVSNRYSKFLSIINTDELIVGEKLDLPGNGGAMAFVPDGKRLVVADAFKPLVYLVNLETRMLEKTIKLPLPEKKTLSDISAMRVLNSEHPELWVASRTQHKVAVINLATDTIIKTLDVGAKPVDFAVNGNRLFVLSAGDARLDVIDWPNRTLLEPVPLADDSFPSDLVTVPSEQRAYITAAGSDTFTIVDLESAQVETIKPVEFRASMITMTPETEVVVESTPAGQPTEVLPPMPVGTPAQPEPTAIGPEQNSAEEKPAPKFSVKEERKQKKALEKAAKRAQKNQQAEAENKPVATPETVPAADPVIETSKQAPAATEPSITTQGPLPVQSSGRLMFNLDRGKQKQKEASLENAEPAASQFQSAESAAPATEPPPMMDESISN